MLEKESEPEIYQNNILDPFLMNYSCLRVGKDRKDDLKAVL